MAQWCLHGLVASFSAKDVIVWKNESRWRTRGVTGKRLRHGKLVASLGILWRGLIAKINITETGRTSMLVILTAPAKHLVDFGSAGALLGNPSLGVISSKPSGVLSRRTMDVQKGFVDMSAAAHRMVSLSTHRAREASRSSSCCSFASHAFFKASPVLVSGQLWVTINYQNISELLHGNDHFQNTSLHCVVCNRDIC